MRRPSSGLARMLLLAALVVMTAASCGGGSDEKTVRGLVTDVQASSITQVDSLTLREEGTGKLWTFQAKEHVGLTPSHIRQHILQGQLLTVHYEERRGQLFAVLVTD